MHNDDGAYRYGARRGRKRLEPLCSDEAFRAAVLGSRSVRAVLVA